jgi:alkanesulfonate monooxygenase SsuD/methylene tetrahydromethanopterin reductase-like flavin-dependent oxidoreductase (luciferase family)
LGCPDGVRAFVCGIMPVGRAADEILDLAGQIGAGLIVIGSRGG